MSITDPTTPEEWERFRFPPRVVRKDPPPPVDEDDEEGEGSSGGMTLTPEFPPGPAWEYNAETGFLMNHGLKKKIDLADLDDAHKIVRMLAVFELRPDLAFPSLKRALEAAALDRFGVSVDELLRSYSGGHPIPWKQSPQSHPGM